MDCMYVDMKYTDTDAGQMNPITPIQDIIQLRQCIELCL